MYQKDTIAAIATPVGSGGIGIIKISGPQALQIIANFFRSATFRTRIPESHRLYYGVLFDPVDGSDLDEVLVAYMRGPTSYTGEDVVEINCHSGLILLRQVLDLALRHGARLAEPGEFTKRAFLNGRIDITRAEAVIDIIDAQSEMGLKVAARQLRGMLAQEIETMRQNLLDVAATVDAMIDFPEENLGDLSPAALRDRVAATASAVHRLIISHKQTVLYKAGIQAVIVGKPNVGKSSLLNALVGDARAIVTPLPGTTRDMIHETIHVQGIPVHLHDTAGIHPDGDHIENIGMEMTLTKMADSDIVLLVLDQSSALDERDLSLIDRIRQKNVITVLNKSDLPQGVSDSSVQSLLPAAHIVRVSALLHQGIDTLGQAIGRTIVHDAHELPSHALLTHTRHKRALESIHSALTVALDGLENGRALELVAIDLRTALDALGHLTGETMTDDVLDTIFSRFCIGK